MQIYSIIWIFQSYINLFASNILNLPKTTILIPKTTFIHSQPKSQLEKPFPDTPKIEFQNETQISDTMKAKSQVEISFLHRKKVISQNISYFHIGRKSERELTNYLLTPKM